MVGAAGLSPARTAGHLARRFVGSLRPGGPSATDEEWARGHLVPGERELWARLPGADRRHAVGVARAVAASLGPEATRPVLAAALLHDIGKLEAGLGVWGRVGATLAGMAGGRTRAERWAVRPGVAGRVGRYLCHPQLGGRLLTAAGSEGLTVAWTESHHLPPERWDPAVSPEVGAVLKACDDD